MTRKKTSTRTSGSKSQTAKPKVHKSSRTQRPASENQRQGKDTKTEGQSTEARRPRRRGRKSEDTAPGQVQSGRKNKSARTEKADPTAPTLQQPPKRRAASPPSPDTEPQKTVTDIPDAKGSSETTSPKPSPSLPGNGSERVDTSTDGYPPGAELHEPVDMWSESGDESESYGDDVGMLGIGSQVFPPQIAQGLFDEELPSDPSVAEELLLPDDSSVEARIREIEARLDGLMSDGPSPQLDALEAAPEAAGGHTSPSLAEAEAAADSARELLESDYYRRKWGRGALAERSQETDDFGWDPAYEERLRPALEFLFKKYFRVDLEGISNIPDAGRCVVVANHSGALPFDGAMLREAARLHHPTSRDLRWLAEDYSFYLPFLGVTLNRLGAVRACQENAERLLRKGHVVGVFPEGSLGQKKLYRDRYKLQRFGRGGFVRLCLKTESPIVPCAIIGAEETNPIIYRFDNLSKLMGLDYLPLTPTFPWLGPLGLLPAPSKWRMLFGEPIELEGYGPEAAQDHVLVGRISERVRKAIAGLLETGLRRRKSVWL